MKKSLLRLLLLAVVLTAGATSALGVQYGLNINGTYVTDANKSNIKPSAGLASGTISYDSSTKTLTLDNIYLTADLSDAIYSTIDGLTIKVVGTCSIHTSSRNGIYLAGNTTINGLNTSTYQCGSLDIYDTAASYAPIYFDASGGTLNMCQLFFTIRGNKYGIYGGSNTKFNCYCLDGDARTSTSGSSAFSGFTSAQFDANDAYLGYGVWDSSKRAVCNTSGAKLDDIRICSKLIVSDCLPKVNAAYAQLLKPGGLTAGSITYYGSSKQIALNGVTCGSNLGFFITSYLDGLSIRVTGNNSVSQPMYLYGNTTISASNASGNALTVKTPKLECAVLLGSSCTLKVGSVELNVQGGHYGLLGQSSSKLDINSAYFYATGSNDYPAVRVPNCTLSYCVPANTTTGMHGVCFRKAYECFCTSNGTASNYVAVRPYTKEYGISILGTPITNENYMYFATDGATGDINYSPMSNTLTLNKVTITSSADNNTNGYPGISVSSNASASDGSAGPLTINCIDDNRITTDDYALSMYGGSIKSTGTLSLVSNKTDALVSNGSGVLSLHNQLRAEGARYGIRTDGILRLYKTSNTQWIGMKGGTGAMRLGGSLYLGEFGVEGNYYTEYRSADKAMVMMSQGQVAKNVEVTLRPVSTWYNIQVGDTRVNNLNASNIGGADILGKVTYTPSTRTLELNGVTISGSQTAIVIGEEAADNHTIKLTGTNRIALKKGSGLGAVLTMVNTTISGSGSLDANETPIHIIGDSKVAKTLTIEGQPTIKAQSLKGSYKTEKLVVKGANTTISGETIEDFASVTLNDGLAFVSPAGGSYNASKACLTTASGTKATSFAIGAAKSYGFTVNGIDVTEANASNISGDGISGKVSYDASTHTLTLDNATITTKVTAIEVSEAFESALTINLKGSNKLVYNGNATDYFNIECYKSLNLTGTGSLTTEASGNKHGSILLRSYNLTMTISGGCQLSVYMIQGYSSTNKLIISGATTKVQTKRITAFGSMTLNDGLAIVTPVGGKFDSTKHEVCTEDGTRATDISIAYAAELRIVADKLSREYGEENPPLTYTVVGGTLQGTPELTCDATPTSAVGTYPISVSRGAVTSPNITFTAGTLTITPAPLTVSGGTFTIEEGQALPDLTQLVYTGFKNGETESALSQKPQVSCSATATSPAGTYPIIVSGGSSKNYSLSYVAGSLTITEATAAAIDLLVDGVSVTEENAADILGNGVFSYDAESKTLTVSGDYTAERDAILINNNVDGLTVNYAADCTLTPPPGKIAMVLNASTIMTGTGKVVVNDCIRVPSDSAEQPLTLTIDNLRLDVNAPYFGIMANGWPYNLVIRNSTLHVTAGQGAITQANTIVLEGCSVVSPQDAVYDGHTYRDADGNDVAVITIMSDADRTAIASPTAAAAADSLYDLQGRRVSRASATKGVYIVGGRKVMVK